MIKIALTALSLALPFGLSAPAAAQVPADMAAVDVLPGWRTSVGTHMAAIRVRLAPGWKTYWRAPGDAGIPAQFDWRGSDNMGAVALHWPTPDVFDQNGMTSIGYHDQLILPLEITPRQPGAPIRLRAEVQMGVCEDICVPILMNITADLPADANRQDARIRAALADQPRSAAAAGVGRVDCAVAATDRGITVTASIELPALGGAEFTVIELPGAPVWVSEAASRRLGGTLTASAEMVPERGKTLALDRSRLRITVMGERGAVDIRGCD